MPGPDRGRLLVSVLLAAAVVALSTAPSLQFEHWPWICLTLAAPVVAYAVVARSRTGTDVPALLAATGALAWSTAALLLGPAGDPGWRQPFPPPTADGPVRLDVAAGVAAAALLLAHLRGPDATARPGRWTVPVVLAVAAGTLGYRLGAGDDAARAVSTALAVLLVAAPGALRRPAPTAPVPVERRVDVVLFTARTLAGDRRLDDVRPAPDTDGDDVLRLAGSVAEPSPHPVARAIAAAAAERGPLPAVGEFDEQPGLGAQGLVAELRAPDSPDAAVPDLAALEGPAGRRPDGTAVTVVAHAVLVGTPELLAGHGITLPPELDDARTTIEAAGHTAVAVAWDGRARGVLAVATDVHPDAVAAVRAARRAGTTPALLSARSPAAATAVADRAGVDPGPDTVLDGVGPDGQAGAVDGLRARGRVVAVVGHPGRDDGALAAADLALPVAPEEPDTHPDTHPDTAAAVAALRRRRRCRGPVPWTLVAAVAHHAVALPWAASGSLDPLLAGLVGFLAAVTFGPPPYGYVRPARRTGHPGPDHGG